MAKPTKDDPTGQRFNRKRTSKALERHLEAARQKIMTVFRDIPHKRRFVTDARADRRAVYDYTLTPEQAEVMARSVREILNDFLVQTQGDNVANKWWYKEEIEQPVRQATLQEINEFNRLVSKAEKAGVTGKAGMALQRVAPEVVLSSQKYLEQLRAVYVENFNTIKTLSNNTASQVIQRINFGMQAGLTPNEISDQIVERFDVAKSNADRIARTEVNKAYNDAKIKATKTASEFTGAKALVRHISALLPERTRRTHAARHYLVYTVDDQEKWWNEGSNRINCLCTVQTVLTDKDGNFIEA